MDEVRLNPQALMAALQANRDHKADPGRKGCGIEKAIRAYLAASPSPSMEIEVVEGLLSNGQPLVMLSQAQSALAAKDAEAKKWWLKCCETQQDLNAAEAQVLRLTEENEALIRERDELVYLMGEVDQGNAIQEARIKALEEALIPFAAITEVPSLGYVTKEMVISARSALKENAL